MSDQTQNERWYVRRTVYGKTHRNPCEDFDHALTIAVCLAKRRRITDKQMAEWTAETQPNPIRIEREVNHLAKWRVNAAWNVWTGREMLTLDNPTVRPMWAWEELEAT